MCGTGSMSSNTSERLSESGSHCIETLDFLRDPFVASLIETHPNQLVAASSSSSSIPRDIEWLDWCDSPIATDSDAETSSDSDLDSGGRKKQKRKLERKQWETILQAYIDSSDARDGGMTCADVRTCFFCFLSLSKTHCGHDDLRVTFLEYTRKNCKVHKSSEEAGPRPFPREMVRFFSENQ